MPILFVPSEPSALQYKALQAYFVPFLAQRWDQSFLQGSLRPFIEDRHLEHETLGEILTIFLMVKDVLMPKTQIV